MTAAYLACAFCAALGFYLASPHQRLWPMPRARVALRGAGWLLSACGLACGVSALGPWAGTCAALSATMLPLVALPYLDAWRQTRRHAHAR